MLLFQFIVFNVLNVVIQTIKSIATIKCGKILAAVINAIAYGLYTYIIILTNVELNLWIKITVVAVANLVGVFVVKLIEEKSRKDKLWKVEATVDSSFISDLHRMLNEGGIPHSWIEIGSTDRVLLNCYCNTQNDSSLVKDLLDASGAKYFVSESKVL